MLFSFLLDQYIKYGFVLISINELNSLFPTDDIAEYLSKTSLIHKLGNLYFTEFKNGKGYKDFVFDEIMYIEDARALEVQFNAKFILFLGEKENIFIKRNLMV